MIIRKLSIILSLSFLFGQAPGEGNSWIENISLSAYAGPGSILLDWDLPDDIKPVEVRILRSDDINGPFTLINTELENSSSRFLDRYVILEERYFYIIEIMSSSGARYSSDRITPVFERIDTPRYSDLIEAQLNQAPVTPSNLIIAEVSQIGMVNDTSSECSIIKVLLNDSYNINMESFLQVVPLKSIPLISNWLVNISDTLLVSHLDRIKDSTAFKYRNDALLTPDEWSNEFDASILTVQNKRSKLQDILNEAILYLDDLAPAFISGIRNNGDSLIIQITDIDLRGEFPLYIEVGQLDALNPLEFYEDDGNFGESRYLAVENSHHSDSIIVSFLPGKTSAIEVPPEGKAINFSLKGTRLVNDKLLPLTYGPSSHNMSMNEIYTSSSNVMIEVYGSMRFEDRYSVFLDDSLIWEIETFYPLVDEFIDSSFSIDLLDSIPRIFHLAKSLKNDSLQLIESYLATDHGLAGKIPDGGKWKTLQAMTAGKTNVIKRSTTNVPGVPELFALYQNYPNPFNGKTRLSFDLLQDSRVNLYVSDALGHVVGRFIVDEFLDKGSYNFTWEGGSHSSGIYFFTLSAEVNGFQPVVFSRKMIYMK